MSPSAAATNTVTTSHIQSAFAMLDADHDGKISPHDLQSFYSHQFPTTTTTTTPSSDIIPTMISLADSNNDGFVDYHEFQRVLNQTQTQTQTQQGYQGVGLNIMEEVFKLMDKDGDGMLSHADLKTFMLFAGLAATDDDIQAMILLACAGGDANHGVTFDGLLRILAIDH